jgi:formate dehydrogenase major subunit/NADH-quinone oxidoreductase subunit G
MTHVSLRKESAFAAVATAPKFVVPQAAAPFSAEAGKLALVTGSALYHNGTLSEYGEGPMHVCPENYVELSRADAAQYKIAEGDVVTVSSSSGSLKLKAIITPRMPAGVVFSPYHFSAAPINTIWSGAPVTSVTVTK